MIGTIVVGISLIIGMILLVLCATAFFFAPTGRKSSDILTLLAGFFFAGFFAIPSLIVPLKSETETRVRPDAIIRTNNITTVVYSNYTYQSEAAEWFIVPDSNIVVILSGGKNLWGRDLIPTESCVIER